MLLNFFLNLEIHWIKQLKYFQENIGLAALKKFLSKNDPSKSPNFKSMSSQIIAFKQLKKNICMKYVFGPQNNLFVWCFFFRPALYVYRIAKVQLKSLESIVHPDKYLLHNMNKSWPSHSTVVLFSTNYLHKVWILILLPKILISPYQY